MVNKIIKCKACNKIFYDVNDRKCPWCGKYNKENNNERNSKNTKSSRKGSKK